MSLSTTNFGSGGKSVAAEAKTQKERRKDEQTSERKIVGELFICIRYRCRDCPLSYKWKVACWERLAYVLRNPYINQITDKIFIQTGFSARVKRMVFITLNPSKLRI